jgi:uncharacterized protein
VKVSKQEKHSSNTCTINLADPEGTIEMPDTGDPIMVAAGFSGLDIGVIFEGTVNDTRSKGGAGSGRTLTISAKSADQKGKIKQQQTRHKDKSKFQDVAREFGQGAGLDVQVIGDIGSIERDYWSMMSESFQSWGQRVAQDIGASFQIIGKRAFFSPMNEGKSASGKDLTPVIAQYGVNLIAWDIAPKLARPDYGKITTKYFDRKTGEHKTRTETVDGASSDAVLTLLHTRPSEDQAVRSAKGAAEKSKREKGGGNVTILGDHAAEPGATCTVIGARAGIDNAYIVESVEHDIDREGWVTELSLKSKTSAKG